MEGTVAEGFEAVADVFARQLAAAPGGGAACVYFRGQPVIDIWGGERNSAGDPWRWDTLSVSFSTTKGIVATLLHQLAGDGVIDYDAPVHHYWPEFRAADKHGISVRDLLTHRAGLHDIRRLDLAFDDMLDWQTVTSRLAAAPADHSKAPHSIYHALTYGWLVGEVIQRASGQSLGNLLEQRLTRPLGLDGLYIGTPEREHHRVAELLMGRAPGSPRKPLTLGRALRKDASRLLGDSLAALSQIGMAPDLSTFVGTVHVRDFHPRKLAQPAGLNAVMPAINGAFTARSLARVYAALANGGELDGQRIIPARHIDVIGEQQEDSLDRALYTPMRWRLGYHQPFIFGLRRPQQAFGHFGYGGSGAWADPKTNLAVALTVNAGSGTPWGDLRILRLGAAALKAARAQR